MTEEIKEILENLNTASEIFDYTLEPKQCTLLLDYITNSKQENEKLKEENRTYQEYPFIIIEKNGVICCQNQEIDRLNNIINELETWLKEENKYSDYKDVFYREHMGYVLDKLKELKESDNK